MDATADIANDPAEISPQGPQRAIGALELLCMGIALMLDQGELPDPLIGLAQINPRPETGGPPASLHTSEYANVGLLDPYPKISALGVLP